MSLLPTTIDIRDETYIKIFSTTPHSFKIILYSTFLIALPCVVLKISSSKVLTPSIWEIISV